MLDGSPDRSIVRRNATRTVKRSGMSLGLALLVWLAAYLGLIRFFLPRIRSHSAARASARAMITGQVVDTITNIKTVKLFAHAEHEDRAALTAMAGFREKAVDFGVVGPVMCVRFAFRCGVRGVVAVRR